MPEASAQKEILEYKMLNRCSFACCNKQSLVGFMVSIMCFLPKIGQWTILTLSTTVSVFSYALDRQLSKRIKQVT